MGFIRGGGISFAGQLKKIIRILVVYAIATFVVMCVTHRRFDLKIYLNYLISFNIQGPYYYLVFFVQLLMVAPILIEWCVFINNKKYKWFMQFGTLMVLGWFASISINYTYILPVHGGGQFLGGGTYVILYYLGMVLASNGVFLQNVTRRVIIAISSASLAVVWLLLMAEGRLPFDVWMSPFWGGGFNPPSVNFMVYSVLVLFLCYSFFSLLSECGNKIISMSINLFCFLGRNTLYIWLYHFLIKSLIADKFPSLLEGNMGIRLLVFCLIIIVPVAVKQLIFQIRKFYCIHIRLEKGGHAL